MPFDKYNYSIVDNLLTHNEYIYCRTIKINGYHNDCVYVSIRYNNNVPVSAYMPNILYESECLHNVFASNPEVIHALFSYIHEQIPTITSIEFDDMTNIEYDMFVCPIPLYFFSIAFNGMTWYEKHFDARMIDDTQYNEYRTKINDMLNNPDKKPTNFIDFVRITQLTNDIHDELSSIYINTTTYNEFFQSIPKNERCRLVGGWISEFMKYYLGKSFQNIGWNIPLPIVKNSGGSRHNLSKRKYYCPIGRIRRYFSHRDIGVDPEHV